MAGYQLFRDGTQIATTAGTNYSDAGLAIGTEHCYRVAAYDHVGHASAQSAEACAQSFDTVNMLLGSYNGLVVQTNAPSHAVSGVKFTVGKAGSFAASVALGGAKAVAFGSNLISPVMRRIQYRVGSGLVAGDSAFGCQRHRSNHGNSLGWCVHVTVAGRPGVYGHKNPCPLAGTFTAVLQPPGR